MISAILNTLSPVASVEITPKEKISPEQINAIISSIQINDAPIKSEKEYFQAALNALDQNNYEQAKMELASALCLNRTNPQYHYYFAVALYKTGIPIYPKYSLEEALKLKKDYREAQDLLNKIKSEKKHP